MCIGEKRLFSKIRVGKEAIVGTSNVAVYVVELGMYVVGNLV